METADLNGDGLPDIWRPGDANGNTRAAEATVWLNSGSGFLASTVIRPVPVLTNPGDNANARLSTTLFVDHNADGRQDILEHWVGGFLDAEFNVALHPDGGVLNLTASFPDDLTFYNPSQERFFPNPLGTVGDIDADGNPDLFGSSAQASYGSGLRNMLLSKVRDGLGNIINVEYEGAYKASCTETTRWPAECVKNMKGLVSAHTEGFADASGFQGELVERRYAYAYENGRIDVTGHGWLGFDKRTVTERVLDQS